MEVLVSDPSVLIDLEYGQVLEPSFSLPFRFVVPDFLYNREIRGRAGVDWLELGLQVERLDGAGIELAFRYRRMRKKLSRSDSFALALAKTKSWTLLSGDGELRALSCEEGVPCHGVLWIFDQMFEMNVVHPGKLFSGLKTISEHKRCRLPKREVEMRLRLYR